MSAYAIGIDLGGTKTDIAVVDSSGKILRNHLMKTKPNPQDVITDILSAIKQLYGREKISGIGVGMAAQIERETGVIHFAPNLGWKEVPFKDELQRQSKLPVWVTNDVRAATWGEWLYGAGRDCDDLICIFVGTGIGGGIVSEGRVLSGYNNTAGEIGHMTIDLHGPKCTCGNRGCFEAFAGGWAIARRAKEVIAYDPAGAIPLLQLAEGKVEDITAKHVFQAYHQHVPLAIKVVEEVKEALVAGVASLVNILSPARVIFGGGIIQAEPFLIDIVRQGIPFRALKAAMKNVQIVEAQLKNTAGVIGAAAYAMRSKEISG